MVTWVPSPLDRKLVRDLWRLKGQALAVAILVACAVAVFVATTATHRLLLRSQNLYYQRCRFGDMFAALRRAPDAVASRIAELPGVAEVETRIVAPARIELLGVRETIDARLVSLPEGTAPRLNRLHLLNGRSLDGRAIDQVIVNQGFASAHRIGPGTRLTVTARGRRTKAVVVGIALSPEVVYAIRPGDLVPDDRHFAVVWMSRPALAAMTSMDGAFNDVTLRLSSGASAAQITARLDQLLAAYGGLGGYGRDRHVSHRFVADEIRQLKAMATVAPAIFLGVACFLLGVVCSRLVALQRQQIGTLKAFGYSSSAIALHFAKLASVIVLAGGAAGAVGGQWLGRAMATMYAGFFRFPFLAFDPETGVAIRAMALAFLAGQLGVLGAVFRALRLTPAEAMRSEPPPAFRPTLVERLGLRRWFGPAGCMVLRQLSRKPVRTGLSSLAVSAAIATVVVGFFFGDAVDLIQKQQFIDSQRQDATVTFLEGRSPAALFELASLPGVRRVEPFRSVPVKLRHLHHTYRTLLVGLPPDRRLVRIIDRRGAYLAPPYQGLMLTAELARMLRIVPGDQIEIESLEGQRSKQHVRVMTLSDESVGVSAYMRLSVLQRFLNQGPLLTGAHLSIDPLEAQALDLRLREMPQVAGVSFRAAALASFRETVAKHVRVFGGLFAVFAAAIAAGVVYNSARVTLAERERDLATLRVLGYTATEAWVVVVGEIGAPVALAIPAGCALGVFLAQFATTVTNTELLRIPAAVQPATHLTAVLLVAAVAAAVMLMARRWLGRIDLLSTLRARD